MNLKLVTLLIVLLTCKLLIYYLNQSLLTEDMIFSDLQEKFGDERALELLKKRQEGLIILIEYGLQVLGLFLRFSVVGLCVLIGCILFNVDFNKHIVFQAMVIAEFVHVMEPMIKFLWFSTIQSNYSSDDLNNFYSFSLYDLLSSMSGEDRSIYRTLRSFNVFEIGYCFAISLQLSQLLTIPRLIATQIVFIPYLSALAILAIVKLYLLAAVS